MLVYGSRYKILPQRTESFRRDEIHSSCFYVRVLTDSLSYPGPGDPRFYPEGLSSFNESRYPSDSDRWFPFYELLTFIRLDRHFDLVLSPY